MMSMYKFRIAIAAVGCLIAFNAFSASDYRCVITSRASAGDESLAVKKSQEKIYLGQEFTVERRTGLMAGILKNSYFTKPQVIDNGSKDNSFKVINSLRLEEGLGSGTNIYALTINEFERTEKKGYVFLVNDTVYLGTCKHF